jgi:TRAP-type C4-dicarboxylate transport system substrate-binding protein
MRLATLALLFATPALAGCFDGGSATKAGGTAGPLTLRLATDDGGGATATAAHEFARRVNVLSRGQIRIEVAPDAVRPGPEYELNSARAVTSGKADMGLMPARSWERVGVTSLRALDAPLLVTSDALLDEIAAGDVATDMLSGLERVGVAGLALLPVGLEHPVGRDGPLLGPDDYEGKVMLGTKAATPNAVMHELGVTFVQGVMPDRRRYTAAPVAFVNGSWGATVGNVTFFAWADVIAINAGVNEELDEQQRATLAQAAEQTREWAARSTPSEAQLARDHCETEPDAGRSVVLASDADVAALAAAMAPVYAELEHDELTRRVIARIRDLKRADRAAPSAVAACGKPLPSLPDAKATHALDGVYRFEVTKDELRDAGVAEPDVIADIAGLWTYELDGGEYCMEHRPLVKISNNPDWVPNECGRYAVDGDRMIMYPADVPPAISRWHTTRGGDLVFEPKPGDSLGRRIDRLLVEDPWRRISD